MNQRKHNITQKLRTKTRFYYIRIYSVGYMIQKLNNSTNSCNYIEPKFNMEL